MPDTKKQADKQNIKLPVKPQLF